MGPLSQSILADVPNEPGVYVLYLNDEPVYAGKADNRLRKRLERHRFALSGRQNMGIEELGFKALTVHRNWSTFATEDAVIRHFRAGGYDLEWNGSGFGSNDPGRRRDHTEEPMDSFNRRYPIDPDILCDWISPGEYAATEMLRLFKRGLPYLLRFQKDGNATQLLQRATIRVATGNVTARVIFREITRQLPGAWQATILPGRMLLYAEDTATYPLGEIVWPLID